MYPKNILGSLLVFALVLAPCAYAGKVELTTYYPSPNGEYTNLTSTSDSSFATTSGNVGIGTTAPDTRLTIQSDGTAASGLKINNVNSDIILYSAASGLAHLYTADGSNLALMESGGNVGIGTATPAAKLDVAGEVKFGNTSSLCDTTNKGQQRYNATSNLMEFCNGTAWTAYGTQRAWVTLSPDIGSCPTGWTYYGAFTWSYNGVSYEQCYKDY